MTIPIKYTLSLSCFLFFLINVQAQNTTIDSLKKALHNHKEKDTIRVNLLYDIAFSLYQKDASLTNSYISEAEAINNELNYKRGKANILSLKGIMESRKSNYDLGLDYFKKSLKLFEGLNDKKGIASSYSSIGINYLQQSKNNEALTFLKKANKIYEEIGNKKNLVASSLNLASIYSEIGNNKEAISYFKKTLKLSKEINHEYGTPYALNGLAHIYRNQGNHYLALDYYHQALIYKEQVGDSLGTTIALNSLGSMYRDIGKLDKSLEYHNKSLKMASKIGNKDLIATNKGNIGQVYKMKEDYEKALTYNIESLKISQEISDFGLMTNCLYNIGEINLLLKKPKIAREYFEKGIKISLKNNIQNTLALYNIGVAKTYFNEKQYQNALKYTLEGERLANKLQDFEAKNKASELLSSIYENLGNYKAALKSHQIFKKLSDSIFNKENIEKITQLEYEYKYKQALDSASIRELKLTNKVKVTSQSLLITKRNYLWAIIGVLLVSIILSSIIFYQKLKNAQAKTETVMIEQKLLRSQMTPHFIFNSLSVLQGMILNKEEKKSAEYLSKFSKLLRITLENSRDKTALLSQELNAIESYLILQNLENNIYNYKLLIDNSIDASNFKVPPMLIQPFVENAIEHAFTNDMINRKIDIQLKYVEGKLICTIIDNGVGYLSKLAMKKNDKTSLSTIITSERLKILAKDFKMDAKATIEDRKMYNEQGTIVTLIIPHKILTS